jgi:hypothetical protein
MAQATKKRLGWVSVVAVAVATVLLVAWAALAQGPAAGQSTMRVYVQDEQFRPVRGATVTIEGRGQSGGEAAAYRQGVTDGTGAFQAHSLAAGGYRVTAELGALSQTQQLYLPERFDLPVTFSLVTTGASVYGQVFDAAGRGVAGVTVTLAGEYPPLERQTATNGGGGFVLSPVPDGRYQVATEDPQGRYAPAGPQVAVVEGKVFDADLVFSVAGSGDLGAIRGRIISSEANSRFVNFEVTATDAAGLQQASVRLGRGEMEFGLSNLPPGVYRVALLRRFNQYDGPREVGATGGVVVKAGETTEEVLVGDREP